jgi:esterase/lipase superfamily enzyme
LCACTGGDDFGRPPDTRSVWHDDGTLHNPIDVFYLTDRARDDTQPGSYGPAWADAPSCGLLHVKVPQAPPTKTWTPPAKFVGDATDLCQSTGDHRDDETAASTLANAIAAHCSALLLYVHGFNTIFATAVYTAAQMAHDTRAPCAATFSFASEGRVSRYSADIEHSAYAAPLLHAFLMDLSRKNLRLNVIAHSMGNRLMLTALSSLRHAGGPARADFISELVLAAADVSNSSGDDDFQKLVDDAVSSDPAGKVPRSVARVTIYASAGDAALATSEGVHDGTRAGRQPLLDLAYQQPGTINVIDATFAPADELGHGYFSKSWEAVGDILYALDGVSVDERLAGVNGNPPTLIWSTRQDNPCGRRDETPRLALNVPKSRSPSWISRLVRCVVPALPSVRLE